MRRLLLIVCLFPCANPATRAALPHLHTLPQTLPTSHPDTLPLITTLSIPTTPLIHPNNPNTPHPATQIILHIRNNGRSPQNKLTLDWALQSNGVITKKGNTPVPAIPANQSISLRLPQRLPDDSAGESFLWLQYRSKPTKPSTPSYRTAPANASTSSNPSTPSYRSTTTAARPAAGTIVASQQLLLKPWRPQLAIAPAGEITLTDDHDIFTIHSPDILISFNRQTGWLVHYEYKGVNLLDDNLGLKSNFWWPGYTDSAAAYAAEAARRRSDSTTNFILTTDSGWLAATREPHLQLFSNTTSPDQIIIRTEYTLPATACLLHLSYTINATGEMLITQRMEPDTTQPAPRNWPLPCFGMQWILPPGYDTITTYGPVTDTTTALISSTPVPIIGLDHPQPLIPAANDPHARARSTSSTIRWYNITNASGAGLHIIADSAFLNISALHSFDSDLIKTPNHPTTHPQLQLSIDRPATPTPKHEEDWPILLPPGTYQYAYKVKPLAPNQHPQ